MSVIAGPDTILGAVHKTVPQAAPREAEPSEWTEEDFAFVKSYLSRACACTTGGLGLTVEFGLRAGEVSARYGDHYTALWEIKADKPHPEIEWSLLPSKHAARDR